jgi:GAF domain-containing protein
MTSLVVPGLTVVAAVIPTAPAGFIAAPLLGLAALGAAIAVGMLVGGRRMAPDEPAGPRPELRVRSERFRLLCEVSRRLAACDNLEALLHFATRRAREVCGVEGCALLLLDRRRRRLTFPVASQHASHAASGSHLAEIHVPAERGVAGWVLAHGRTALVPDVRRDARFWDGVDRATGATTRAVLCAPLRTPHGNIGVLELVNPIVGTFSGEDVALAEALASEVAVAYEQARLYRRVGEERLETPRLLRLLGGALVGLGGLLAGGAVYRQLALALPLRELAAGPDAIPALLATLAGLGLVTLARSLPLLPLREARS